VRLDAPPGTRTSPGQSVRGPTPSEKATGCQNQTGKARTGDGTGDGLECGLEPYVNWVLAPRFRCPLTRVISISQKRETARNDWGRIHATRREASGRQWHSKNPVPPEWKLRDAKERHVFVAGSQAQIGIESKSGVYQRHSLFEWRF
jgi:hypothetical protein